MNLCGGPLHKYDSRETWKADKSYEKNNRKWTEQCVAYLLNSGSYHTLLSYLSVRKNPL